MPLRSPILQAALIATVGGLSLAGNAGFFEPPRFDGAGYAILARSILERGDYREIDKPDAPRHAHFPPGYPLALAAVWKITGVSVVAAHAFSFGCTLAAMLISWALFRSWFTPKVAFLMGLALAMNWRWGRDGTAIQSEPLFLLLGQAALWVSIGVLRRGGTWRGAFLGLLLGAAILTRHVGIALAGAIVFDLVLRGKRREAVMVSVSMAAVLSPWIFRLATVRTGTQIGLVPVGGMASTILENSLFYVRRLMDQIVGPVIEVATVFRPRYRLGATVFAVFTVVPIIWGWVRLVRSLKRRPAGLVTGFTLILLLAWPFTEAGRFLIPLIPFLIAGMVEGLGRLLVFPLVGWASLPVIFQKRAATPVPLGKIGDARYSRRKPRVLAAWLVLALSMPYAIYAIASNRSQAARETHRDFDAACRWIARQSEPGPVLTRHPGDVFWLTGRTALSAETGDIAEMISRHRVAFLLVDDDRFANSPKSPLGRFGDENPGRVDPPFVSPGGHSVSVYRVRRRNPD